jgi:hypothetical protein
MHNGTLRRERDRTTEPFDTLKQDIMRVERPSKAGEAYVHVKSVFARHRQEAIKTDP